MGSIVLPNETEKVLKQFLDEQHVTGYSITINSATVPGENNAGFIYRIVIKGKNHLKANVQYVLVAKIAPNNENIRLAFPVREVYEREVYCYTTVFPELIKFQHEQKISNLFSSFPKLYKASLEGSNETLLLEDFSELGYKKQDPVQTLDYDYAYSIIKEYGKLHALSFALKLHKPDTFEYLKRHTTDHVFQTTVVSETRRTGQKMKTDFVLNKCLDKNKDAIAHEMFTKFSEKMHLLVKEAVKVENSDEYSVLTHGDCCTNNYMFKYEQDLTISKICMLDWQLSRFGSPALDLSNFIFCCTSQSFRKEHYTNLLKEYYRSFATFLDEFGFDAKDVFPFTVLENHLKRFSVYGLYTALFVLNFTLLQGKHIPTLQGSKTEADYFRMREPRDCKEYETFISRMRGVVIDFVNLGFEI